MNPILIIDFDSTFIQDETLDEIANLVADNNQKKEIKNITNQAMEGKITPRFCIDSRRIRC